LHVFSTLAVGGPQVRTADLVTGFGEELEHVLVAADGCTDALERLHFGGPVETRPFALVKGGGVAPGNLRRVARLVAETRPTLLLTYNFGALEAALANRLWCRLPHLHFEDGFGADETPQRQLRRRVWLRRLALGPRTIVVVPSRTLEQLAMARWRLPASRVRYIANGIDLARFDRARLAPAERPGDDATIVVGAVGGLRREKNLPRLLRAVARLAPSLPLRLVLVGDGPERAQLEHEALALKIAERVCFTGHRPDPERWLATFDIFALSSDTEQMPLGLIEAMAAGLPVVATDVGDVAAMVPEPSRAFVASTTDEAGFIGGLERLARDPALRHGLGAANRSHAETHFARDTMLERYRALFSELTGCSLSRPTSYAAAPA
jgi:glycosyltransferase involved in cell wall biosynthesis